MAKPRTQEEFGELLQTIETEAEKQSAHSLKLYGWHERFVGILGDEGGGVRKTITPDEEKRFEFQYEKFSRFIAHHQIEGFDRWLKGNGCPPR